MSTTQVPRADEQIPDLPLVDYAEAAKVKPAERDYCLDINGSEWPPQAPPEWAATPHGLARRIAADEGDPPAMPAELEESILRFPSAPIHGLQRLHEHHAKLGPSENFHSFRIIRAPGREREPISRIFLMHTGLNESGTMGLYYRLSSQLIEADPSTVCIVRPFPGHLTRYPFQAFAETPLDLYLGDGSHLFRQFMRFMIETQWLLSALVRRSSYRCASGANLLGERAAVAGSRLDSRCLAEEMKEQWGRLQAASTKTARGEIKEAKVREADASSDQQKRTPVNQGGADDEQFLAAVEGLRETLCLDLFEPQGGEVTKRKGPPEPSIHVLGYSLGGFTAQSVFMSWPFIIASCSTVLAGGALRELAPTGFADPEEWQTVLHSLRYELDDRLMSKHVGVGDDTVAGIDRDLFTYLKRTFYEVFQQEYRGSIQSRYEAFGDRMFFIVGGNDPVVRPEKVLQSGPKGGLNLLEIGGLGHFLQDGGSDANGEHQKTFWLPEMAALIDRFSKNAAKEHELERELTWFDEKMAEPALTRAEWNRAISPGKGGGDPENEKAIVRQLTPAELVGIEHDGALPGALFERCLDDLLHRVSVQKDGLLFAFRNEVPTAFLPPQTVRETASALYHDDFNIVRYCHGIAARREVIRDHIGHIGLVLPWNARSIMRRMDLQRAYPSQAETAGGQVKERLSSDEVWRESLHRLRELSQRRKGTESIRVFDGNEPTAPGHQAATAREADGELADLIRAGRAVSHDSTRIAPPSLPDTWVWMSSDLLVPSPARQSGTTRQPDVARGRRALLDIGPEACESQKTMQDHIRDEKIRIVTVSRGRYNPRFRGRMVVDGKAARKRFIHCMLCLAMSETIAGKDLAEAFV